MKQRILLAALALCVCMSSQSVACAQPEDASEPEEVLTEGSTEEEETGEEDTDPPEDASESEEVLTEEATEEEEISEEEDTDPSEDASEPEEVLAEESAEEEETSENIDTDLPAINLQPEKALVKKSMNRSVTRDTADLTPTAVYEAMIALESEYEEGTIWTDDEPYSSSSGYYHWKGGTLDGVNISAAGCVAFAFELSDAAFGSLPARMCGAGQFTFEDIKVGDILRLNNDTHTVIVLQLSDAGVVIAEGNYNGKVHWGRAISRDVVMRDTSHYITRYPEGYTPPDDPGASDSMAHGTLDGGLTWDLTKAGVLTISGKGAMPDFDSTGEWPWNDDSSKIQKVVIGNGVTSIGSCAFWNCGALSAEISSSVTAIGSSAFYGSGILSVTIPSSVKTIGDSAFQKCQNLSSVTVSEGLETIGQKAFSACTNLASISLPASIEEVGAGAFFDCETMKSATFAAGSNQVKLGDNIFTECWNLMSVKLPQNIDCIGEGMFLNCKMLAGVEIPQGAESIGNRAFASCVGMSVVVIPNSVTTIGTAAFSDCPLKDIYFTGTEAEWDNIRKTADVTTAVSGATMHFNYTPAASPDPDDGDDSNNGSDNTGDNSGNDHGGDRHENNSSADISVQNDSDEDDLDINAVVETWKPTTPDEIRRYDCVGKESIRYTQPEDTVYPIDIENAVQGPMCFQSFETVLGEYTIGRTYNIYALSETAYSTDRKVQITLEIPSVLWKKDREYKMICVTKGGQPFVYDDLDSDPETITIETDKFHAYALIYK